MGQIRDKGAVAASQEEGAEVGSDAVARLTQALPYGAQCSRGADTE